MALTLGYERFVRESTDSNGNTVLVGADGDIGVVPMGNTLAIIGNSIVAQCMPYSATTTRWAPGTAKALTNAVAPMSYSGVLRSLKYVCTVAGTTASGYGNEPDWPTVAGQTVTDGTVTWEAQVDGDIQPSSGSNWWFWSQALSGQRLREVYVAGLSGKKMADIAQLKDAVNASGAGVVFLPSVFVNDIWGTSAGTAANVTAAYETWETMCDEWRRAGKTVIVTTELPNGEIDSNGTAFTGYLATRGGTKLWYWINDKIRAYALRYSDSVKLIDFANIYLDTNPANPVWPDNATTYITLAGGTQKLTDKVHPYTPGAIKIGQKCAAFIGATFPAVDHFGNGAGSAYDEDPNPANYGTAGTALTGVTEDPAGDGIANSMTVRASGGTDAAITASKVARSDVSGSWQRTVYTATAGDTDEYTWYKAAASIGLVAGEIVECIAEYKVSANPVGLGRCEAQIRFHGGANPQWVKSGFISSTDAELGQFLTEDTVLTLRTPGVVVPSGVSGISVYQNAYGRAIACNFTVDMGRRVLRRKTTPALA